MNENGIVSELRKVIAIGVVLLGRISVLVAWIYFIAIYEPPILRDIAATTTLPEPYAIIPSVLTVFGTVFMIFILLYASFWRKLFLNIRGSRLKVKVSST